MDARKEIEADIRACVTKGLQLGVLINPRIPGDFYSSRAHITSKYSYFSDEADYLKNAHLKYEQSEYFVALEDGAFLQLNYEFEINRRRESFLTKMNLCYLPPVTDLGEIKNEYIRMDYNRSASDNSFFHAFAHLHIGFKNSIRIPIDEVLFFSEFLAFILYLFYPEQFSLLFGSKYATTNTRQASGYGKLTKDIVLSKELERFIYLKTQNSN